MSHFFITVYVLFNTILYIYKIVNDYIQKIYNLKKRKKSKCNIQYALYLH